MNKKQREISKEEKTQILELYKNHLNNLDSLNAKKIVKNFENYMNIVENSRIVNLTKDYDRLSDFLEKNRLEFFNMEKKYLKPLNLQTEYFKGKESLILRLIIKIWLNEKVSIEDIKNIPEFKLIYIFIVVKRKFKFILNINDLNSMVIELNNLDCILKKRKEEILKFILKRFFKYIFTFDQFRNQNKEQMIKILFKKYFTGKLTFKHFKTFFNITKRAEFPILIIFNNELIRKILKSKSLQELIHY